MSIISGLATSQNRKDEIPNQELAKAIATAGDKKAIKELFENLNNKNKGIQSDCIKVIYEIGEQKPKLIAGFADELIELLNNKNNRLQWGAMTALHLITAEAPKKIYDALPAIIDVADKGSVITNDHCVGILIKLCGMKEYAENAFSLLNERLIKSPTNQLPMYAEKALLIITEKNKATFIKTLISRLGEIEKDSKRIRVEKVIKKLNNN
jgi:HEAT repeat protein